MEHPSDVAIKTAAKSGMTPNTIDSDFESRQKIRSLSLENSDGGRTTPSQNASAVLLSHPPITRKPDPFSKERTFHDSGIGKGVTTNAYSRFIDEFATAPSSWRSGLFHSVGGLAIEGALNLGFLAECSPENGDRHKTFCKSSATICRTQKIL